MNMKDTYLHIKEDNFIWFLKEKIKLVNTILTKFLQQFTFSP